MCAWGDGGLYQLIRFAVPLGCTALQHYISTLPRPTHTFPPLRNREAQRIGLAETSKDHPDPQTPILELRPMGPRRLVAPKMELKDPIQGPKGRPEGAQRGHGDTGAPVTLKAFQSDRTQGVPMSARMGLKALIQGPK